MVLYITSSTEIDEIAKEISHVLSKEESRMLIYYTKNGPPLPDIILDYISREQVKIKRLPLPIENCDAILAYEIGAVHALEPDTQFILWGNKSFEKIYGLLMQYDNSLMKKVSMQSFNRKNAPSAGQENTRSTEGKGKEPRTSRRETFQQQLDKTRSQKNNKKESKKNSTKSNPEESSNNKNPKESSTEKADENPFSKRHTVSGEESRHILDEYHDEKTGKTQVRKNSVPSKADPDSDDPSKETKEREQSTMAVNTINVDKMLSEFKTMLTDVLGEVPTENQTYNVMMCVLECKDIVDKEMLLNIYKEKLVEYFASERKAKYYWEKTKNKLDSLLSFVH